MRIGGSYRRSRAATIAAIAPVLAWAMVLGLATELRAGATGDAGDPASILARVAAALFPGGGPPLALRAEGVVERAGVVVGRIETLASRTPRALRETLVVDGVRQVITLVGDAAWIEDPNGVARPASGDELTAILAAHALQFHDWADGALEGFDVRVDAAGDTAAVVTLSPRPAGPARRLFLASDPAGRLLPRRFEESEEGRTVVTTFEDWRVVDGMRLSFAARQSTGDPRFDLSMRTTSIVPLDSLPAEAVVPPAPTPRGGAAFTDAARARDIALVKIGGVPFVKVEVDGVGDLGFLIDTGAAATIVSSELVDRLNLESRGIVEARGAGGSEVARYVDVASLKLPGVELRDQTVVALPLHSISAALAQPVDGILGYDFLNRFAVEIDDVAGRLALYPRGGYVPHPDAIRLPLRLESNVPRLDGTIEGHHAGSFLLDTGNSTPLLLHTSFAVAEGFLDRARDSTFSLSGVGGELSMQQVVVDSLSFGPLAFTSVTAVLAPEGTGVVSLESSIGNVGSALFAGRRLAFDYGEGALWVSAEPAEPAAASADSASAR